MVVDLSLPGCISTSPSDCATFGNSIMSHGMSPAISEFLNQAQASLNQIVFLVNKVCVL